ncbi:MAG: sulfotransferase [Planctomycetota bacterium]
MQTAGPETTKQAKTVRSVRDLLVAGKLEEAIKVFADLPKKLEDDAELLFLRATTLDMLRRLREALPYVKRSVEIREHPDALLLLAKTYRAIGETELALAACDRVKVLRPGGPVAELMRGGILEEAGRFEEATAVIEPLYTRAVEHNLKMPIGLPIEWSKLLVQNKRYGEAIELIDRTLTREDSNEQLRSLQLHLRAKACDRSKDYTGAIDSARQANAIGKVAFSADLYTEQVTALIENWSRENMAAFPLSGCESAVPVFVAGMPRSGTSLIDQIIDAHPKAAGVGELNTIERFAIELSRVYDPDKPEKKRFGKFDSFRWTRAANDYVKQITESAAASGKPDAERIVNKALGNNKLVGLFARLFPRTRVIHAIRDPRDVAVSCFMGGFNNKLHAWTTQVDWVSHAWNQSMRMMDHWKQALDIPILDVHYERLVADPENEMPRIIEFLGLEWDDACREFYKSKRTVRTLSYDQVNRPLYTSSSGRHKNFGPLLEGVEFAGYDPFADR